MKKCILKSSLVIIVALLVWGAYIAFKPEPRTIGDLMESYEDPGIKIKIRSPFSGSVLVAKKGKIIFKEAYGESDRVNKISNTIETKYGIGSVTKQFTAMLIMQLVEEKSIKLQDTIGKYLPYLSKEKASQITIHQLLSHTSGISHYNGLQPIGVSLKEFGNTNYTPKALAKLIDRTRLVSTPGTEYYYSSLGYDLLGVILEKVSGKSFAELLNEKIVNPLKLKNTGFGTNTYVSKELAKGYSYREVYGWNWWVSEHGGKITEAPFRDQSTSYAAGGMHSTVKDLFIWSEAVKSHKLLSSELTRVMLTPNKHGHCYGWVRNWDDIIEKNIKVRLYGHGGALAGNSAFIAMYDDETTIIYLANRSNLKAEEILHQIHLRANNLKDDFKLKGYPNRSSHKKFREAGGMKALQDYFNRLSEYSGYKVNPSNSTMRGVMKIHLEAGKIEVADSLKTVFFSNYNPDERTLNEFGYDFLYSDIPSYALDFFKENTIRFPKSSNAWDSLGEAYLTYKKYENAIVCYKKAVELGEQVNHRSLELYKENLKKVKQLSNK
ncbi:serine hydrolase [Polaribacter ponticola]|uniref:Serine hydrolase n=1 Tax=Polaribacter ponticola TaxID=2978475 RepID=A0ABT5SBF6_9FLAO|nr:serine hydrolase [Polaribacter sp. MSW5]MDD7915441.1 serine hydrolase [Polaribacter sp. MSW5]